MEDPFQTFAFASENKEIQHNKSALTLLCIIILHILRFFNRILEKSFGKIIFTY